MSRLIFAIDFSRFFGFSIAIDFSRFFLKNQLRLKKSIAIDFFQSLDGLGRRHDANSHKEDVSFDAAPFVPDSALLDIASSQADFPPLVLYRDLCGSLALYGLRTQFRGCSYQLNAMQICFEGRYAAKLICHLLQLKRQ